MKMRNQTGFTLVELIAVMGILSVVMGIAVTLLFQMFDLQMRSEENSERTRSTNRFVAAFRRDIQNYGKPELLATGEKPLRWTREGKTVEYELLNGQHPGQRSVHRVERTDAQIHSAENYALPDGAAVYFFEGKDQHAGLVALSIWQQTPGSEPPKPDEMNPFERSLSGTFANGTEYAGSWRTVLARFQTEEKTEGKPQ
jgi:prepilin-type N-terminal cleavage/methylation domain-containing protein